jgi:hypothetical protein
MEVHLSEPVWDAAADERDGARDRGPFEPRVMLGLFHGRAQIAVPEILRSARPLIALGGFRGDFVPHEVVIRDGQVVSEDAEAHARTLVGVNQDGRVLMLLVADGYNPGVSLGLSVRDAGAVLKAAGAQQALFFDGGGSSTLVSRDHGGSAIVLNRPAGLQTRPGTLRYVAVNLGFTGLQRSDDPLPALTEWEAPVAVVMWEKTRVWASSHRPLAVLITGVVVVSFILLMRVIRHIRRRYPRVDRA